MTKQIAETILHQLGGRRFITMTGARNFLVLSAPAGISFHIPGTMAKGRSNRVRITLNGSDLYDVTFGRETNSKLSGVSYKVVSEFNGIHAENLAKLFEEETGLYTRF